MPDHWLYTLIGVAALGCGVVGGVFFAFSTFVLQGLARLPPPAGLAAMQSINVTAVRPAFMGALFGTGAVCGAVVVGVFTTWDEGAGVLPLAASALYVLGNIAVTGSANVPLNDVLATLDPDSDEAPERWRAYVRTWSRWNHVRTLTAVTASALFLATLAV